jgi:hypothetical protein
MTRRNKIGLVVYWILSTILLVISTRNAIK